MECPLLNGKSEDWSFSLADSTRSAIGSGRIYICCPSDMSTGTNGWLSEISDVIF
jgi:hypothetical protein